MWSTGWSPVITDHSELAMISASASQSSPDLLPNHTLSFRGKSRFILLSTVSLIHTVLKAGDSGVPNGWMAIRRMTEMRERNGVVAYIGPDHSCATEALVAAAWNLPLITYVRHGIHNHFLRLWFKSIVGQLLPLSSCANDSNGAVLY